MAKRIGIVTGTRAEFGLLARTIEMLQLDDRFQTCVFACGTHLSPEYGYTINELKDSGVKNIEPIEMLLSSASRIGVAKSVGVAITSFADAFSRNHLDGLLVLGDRYEILAAAQTALFLDIPLVHIHGGEVTEGAFDDAIRHSITKMANLHFPVAEEFANRIKQMGEDEESIFVVGSPGIDNILNAQRMEKTQLENSLGFKIGGRTVLVTYHPVTKARSTNENDITPLINVIKRNAQLSFVVTYPNADSGGSEIIEQWQSVAEFEHINLVPSLGYIRYLSLMEHVECVIGNSSSGIIEAPSFKVPTINIGTRQHGRPRSVSVIDVLMDEQGISTALDMTTFDEFKNKVEKCVNPYGQGGTAAEIIELLARLDLDSYRIKMFRDN